MIRKLVIAVISVLMMFSVAAAENSGGLPDMMKAGDQELKLNGSGIRTKFFIKVYAGGLYLQQAGQSNTMKIIQADEPMAIRMQWMRDVDGGRIVDGWNSGFSHSLNGNTAPFQDKIDRFNSVFKNGVKKGEVHDIVYMPGSGITVLKDGSVVEKLDGKDFKEAVFGIWLGENTEIPDLRDKMCPK